MKKDDAFVGKTQTRKNLFNFLMLGETSGLVQFLGGIVLVILVIVPFIIK